VACGPGGGGVPKLAVDLCQKTLTPPDEARRVGGWRILKLKYRVGSCVRRHKGHVTRLYVCVCVEFMELVRLFGKYLMPSAVAYIYCHTNNNEILYIGNKRHAGGAQRPDQ
jgi:hypothetical protein